MMVVGEEQSVFFFSYVPKKAKCAPIDSTVSMFISSMGTVGFIKYCMKLRRKPGERGEVVIEENIGGRFDQHITCMSIILKD